ncbi:MAG: histone deacetylase [Zhengella sp.]|uniref:histone deacetylase family protein n=1 Tax=Zhengella sp. TaxID=2282762 RepID=UPI001DC977D0|nr:histone deacetylase [Notoacmeibacter sp.]MCC0025391.1 histone deacetylase [Brucellaceae bacterium]
MALHIVHHPDYDARFSPVHRFPMSKYTLLMTALRGRGLVRPGHLHEPGEAARGWLTLAHDPAYVDQVIGCAVPARIEKEIGFPVDAAVSRRARLASAGTVLAARLALEHGVACNAAGGSHHARRMQGAGFCTFNDVGVAASVLLATGEAARILVVDCDVHQGDGTADIFRDEPRVFTFSLHGARNYPVRKISGDLDLDLPDGTADEAYLATLAEALGRIEQRFLPDLVFYNGGVDPHAGDRLGRLSLSDDGLRARDRMVFYHFRERGIPVCGVIGGGYAREMTGLGERHAILFEVAAEFAAEPLSARPQPFR